MDNICATEADLPMLGHDTRKGGSDTVKDQTGEIIVTDVVIQSLPPDTIQALSLRAEAEGIPLDVFIRNLVVDAAGTRPPLDHDEVLKVMELVKDLADPEIMSGAWH